MMRRWHATGFLLVLYVNYATSQLPPRLQIPGAVPVGGARPAPFRTQAAPPSARLRRPNILPVAREVRPVVEEIEEPNYPSQSPTSAFDDEVNKLGLAIQSVNDEDDRASSLSFRPERPIPIAREQIREKPRPTISAPIPAPRPLIRQEIREDPVPIRQAPVRQQISRPTAAPIQNFRSTPVKISARQQALDDEEEDLRDRRRKPVSQILRKYRTDNEDGSITWGFENDDGTFKEETLGADCIIRGKYGYIDPDGVKRDFSYETGNKCDEPELDEEELQPQRPNIPQIKNRPVQYRPAAAQPQFVN